MRPADLFGVEEADGPGSGVAGVGERRLALILLLPVDPAERSEGEIDLAPDFDLPRLADHERQAADGFDVGADVVAAQPVAAGQRLGVFSIAIEDGDAQPVDLELGHVLDLLIGRSFRTRSSNSLSSSTL